MIKKFQFGKNLPTAPNAKEAYKGGTYEDGLITDIVSSKPVEDYSNRTIVRKINPFTEDTTFVETPEKFEPHNSLRAPVSRKARSFDKDRTEYEILKRRFDEAASVVGDTIISKPKQIVLPIKQYLQQGGQMQEQDVQQQIVQLVQAAMQGDQQAAQTIQQVMQAAERGDQQAIQLAQMIQQVAKQMQGQTISAKLGSKLKYIKKLKYANGGKTCPTCGTGNELKKKDNNYRVIWSGKKDPENYDPYQPIEHGVTDHNFVTTTKPSVNTIRFFFPLGTDKFAGQYDTPVRVRYENERAHKGFVRPGNIEGIPLEPIDLYFDTYRDYINSEVHRDGTLTALDYRDQYGVNSSGYKAYAKAMQERDNYLKQQAYDRQKISQKLDNDYKMEIQQQLLEAAKNRRTYPKVDDIYETEPQQLLSEY